MYKNFLSLDISLEIGFFIYRNSNLSNLKIYSELQSIGITSSTTTLNEVINKFLDNLSGSECLFLCNQGALDNGITDLPNGYGLLTIWDWHGRVTVYFQTNKVYFMTDNTTTIRNKTADDLTIVPYVRNNLTASSYTDGEVLSAYQGYLLNQNKAPSSTFNYLKTYFQNALCEGDSHENFRLQVVQITEPSNQSGDDRLAYLRSQFMSSSVIGVNRIGIIRYSDKNENWYLGIGLKTTDPASRCQILVTNYFGELHLLTYAPFDGSSLSWRDFSINDPQETGIQIGAGQSYSFTYDNFCRVTAFRGSNWFDFTCDAWSALTSRNKTTGFDVTATCSNKTITIKNNEGSAINVLVQRPSYVAESS